MAGCKKQTKGRQKITMKRIENEEDRLLTFSKRRSGIYKKASELVTLCGAEVGILVFSPAGKPFSFGHPSLESVASRFLAKNSSLLLNDNTHPLVEAHRRIRISKLNQQYNEVHCRLEAEKDRGNILKEMMKRKELRQSNWWEAPVDELNLQELQQMYAMFEELHTHLCNKFNGIFSFSSSSSSLRNNSPFASNASGYGYGHNHF